MQEYSTNEGGRFITAKEMMDRFPQETEEKSRPRNNGLFEVDSQGRFVDKHEEEKANVGMSMRDLVFQTAREMQGGRLLSRRVYQRRRSRMEVCKERSF